MGQALSSLALRVTAVLASLLASIALARVLGPDQYGVYAFAFALVSMLALPVQMGLPTLITRETAAAVANRDWPLLRGLWRWSTRTVFAGSCIVLGMALAGVLLFRSQLSAERELALLAGLPLVPLLAWGQARAAALRGLKRVFLGGFPDDVMRPLLLAALIVLCGLFAVPALNASFALLLHAAAALAAALFGAIALRRARPRALAEAGEMRRDTRGWWRAIVPLSLTAGITVVNGNMDLMVLAVYWPDANVGQYRIALSIAALGVLGHRAVNLGAQAQFVELYEKDRAGLQRLMVRLASLSFALSLGAALLMWFFGEALIGLVYGEAYAGAWLPLSILMLGALAHSALGMSGSVLTMTGHEVAVLRFSLAAACLNVVANLLLVPSWGLIGAASATAGSLALGELLKYLYARRVLGLDGSPLAAGLGAVGLQPRGDSA